MMRVVLVLAGPLLYPSELTSAEALRPAWDLTQLAKPPRTHPADGFVASSPQIRALFFEGLPYHGHPTRVIA
jgi:hypothetical protein